MHDDQPKTTNPEDLPPAKACPLTLGHILGAALNYAGGIARFKNAARMAEVQTLHPTQPQMVPPALPDLEALLSFMQSGAFQQAALCFEKNCALWTVDDEGNGRCSFLDRRGER